MTVENNIKKTVATTDGLAGTADPVTSTMQLFTEVPGFTALSFATAAAFGAFSLMLPVIPLAVILTTGSDTLAGATTMVFMAVTVATQLVTNRIIRRYGYRRVMLAAAFLLGVPTLWYLVSMDAASLLLVAAVRGMGFGSLCVAQFALVAHIAPPGALGKASGIIGLFTGAAQMVGLPAGLWLSEHVGNSVVFIAGALVALVAAGLAVLIHNPAPEPVISHPEPPLEHGRKQLRMREKLRGGTVWVLAAPAVAMTTVAMGYGALSSFLPATVKDVDPVQGASFAGLLLAVVGMGRSGGKTRVAHVRGPRIGNSVARGDGGDYIGGITARLAACFRNFVRVWFRVCVHRGNAGNVHAGAAGPNRPGLHRVERRLRHRHRQRRDPLGAGCRMAGLYRDFPGVRACGHRWGYRRDR